MQETNPSAVVFDNVSLQIGKKNILTNISLTIPAHSITGILGPNGAIITKDGKSYVLNAQTRQQIPVTLGTQGVAKTEITNGLTIGTIIVANPE